MWAADVNDVMSLAASVSLEGPKRLKQVQGISISGTGHRRSMSVALYIETLLIVNTLRPGQNGRHFADDIFKCIFLNENVWIPIKISLKFVPKGWINNIPAMVQIMAWRRPGDKPLSEPMMVRLPTHICVTRPRWVNWSRRSDVYMRQYTRLSSVQIMTSSFGAKASSELILVYCQLDP